MLFINNFNTLLYNSLPLIKINRNELYKGVLKFASLFSPEPLFAGLKFRDFLKNMKNAKIKAHEIK